MRIHFFFSFLPHTLAEERTASSAQKQRMVRTARVLISSRREVSRDGGGATGRWCVDAVQFYNFPLVFFFTASATGSGSQFRSRFEQLFPHPPRSPVGQKQTNHRTFISGRRKHLQNAPMNASGTVNVHVKLFVGDMLAAQPESGLFMLGPPPLLLLRKVLSGTRLLSLQRISLAESIEGGCFVFGW